MTLINKRGRRRRAGGAGFTRKKTISHQGLIIFALMIFAIWFFKFRAPAIAFGERFYAIQIAACKTKKCAAETVDRLKKLGHNAFSRYETVPGKGKWYRVYVERFKTRAEAEKEAKASRDLGLIGEYSVRAIVEDGDRPLLPKNKVYFLHVCSYQDESLAKERVARLEKLDLKAFMVQERVLNKNWFRIYIGEYADAKEARRTGRALKEKGIIDYFKPIKIDKKAVLSDE